MTMRWRSSANETPAAGTVDAKETEASHEAASASTSASTASSNMSSPLIVHDDDAVESSLSAATMMQHSNSTSSQQQHLEANAHSSQALDSSSMADSASNLDGDPPYNKRLSASESLADAPDMGGGVEGLSPNSLYRNLAQSASTSPGRNKSSSLGLPSLESMNSASEADDAGNDQEVPWKPQATQSTCEFTHTIINYSQKRDSGCKKAEYSATTVDEFGNRWRLIVYVNGNGRASNHHLSLFLQVADADDLPFGWKKAVSYVLTLEHPTGPNLSYAKRNPDKTFKLCPKAIDWGWSQFITSDRIQQEGFVQEDSLVVRASVTVKSSSVSIDLDDAELYLKCAVEEGKPEAVQLCLDQGAKVNCQFKDDLYTPLHTACSSSTVDDDDDEDDEEDDDVVDRDIEKKRSERTSDSMRVLQLLLEKGADGNACNKWRETPLLIAANNGHRSAVEALLKHGANPSLCSEAGWSALTFAAHKGYDDIVQLLLKAGAPVNCRVTEDASTPLHKACAGSKPGHLAAVKLLLANQADVHALNKWRETPLLTAANHGQDGAVDALLKAGADPCKCTDTGWSPLSIAAYKGHDDVVKLLLEEGAPTEEADPTLSALLQAATKGLPETVELLLKHGADHTVTTKKGDTALSILVEQNLIDAAVDMVTEYNASIPRCSRDRKKVQRARLLINLRIKQRQREGKNIKSLDSDDDDETDHEELVEAEDQAAAAQHQEENGDGPNGGNGSKAGKKKKRNKKKKMSAEQQAKAAEEALLLELEQEDADRHKQEQEANKKSAKKRKKKERERQQKKEQEEERLAKEKEQEEEQRKEREAKLAKERAERDRLLAIKRKEEEVERKRILEKQKREQQVREQQLRDEQRKREKEAQQKKQQEQAAQEIAKQTAEKKAAQQAKQTKRPQTASPASQVPRAEAGAGNSAPAKPVAKSQPSTSSVASSSSGSRAGGKNRGWETKPVPNNVNQEPLQRAQSAIVGNIMSQSNVPGLGTTPRSASNFITQSHETSNQMDLFASNATSGSFSSVGGSLFNPPAPEPVKYTKSEPVMKGFSNPTFSSSSSMEMPAVALFRQEKLGELFQRCSLARSTSDPLGVIEEATMRKVVLRWVVRAAHENTAHLDCIIPSWTDHEQLATFFQRQFISESRKGANASDIRRSMISMEALRDAGSAAALLCHTLAKDFADYRMQSESQLPADWNDITIGMKASEVASNGSGSSSTIVLSWAGRARVYVTSLMFSKLRERYTGPHARLLTSIFSLKVRYETKTMVSGETSLDFEVPAETKSILSMKCNVTAEVWSSPFSTLSGNIFWGQFSDVDTVFGGVAPFSTAESGEELLAHHGGSVCVTMPLDSMVASRYMHKMFDILEAAEKSNVPVSFYTFIRSDSFVDGNQAPTANELYMLEPRLRERNDFIARVEELPAGQHSFPNAKRGGLENSATGSIFLTLQNVQAKSHVRMGDLIVAELLRSLGVEISLSMGQSNDQLPLMSEMSFSAPEFVPAASRNQDFLVGGATKGGFFNHSKPQAPSSPLPHPGMLSDFGTTASSDFGGFGGNSLGGAFSNSMAPASRSTRPARGRLFDLVDDEGDDDQGAADVVSGMLGNLNMDDLFSQQPNATSSNGGEIDIEAISLMGITGPPPSTNNLQPRRSRFG